jgi:CheY-like chemotaxis protein
MKRILVIDDDAFVRETFAMALSGLGYLVDTADGGLAGLDAADRHKPDLIFLDLKMPGLDGVETLRRLGVRRPGVPVYIVTGFHTEYLEPLRQLKSSGLSFDVARKPLELSQIRAIADSVLASNPRARSVTLVGA